MFDPAAPFLPRSTLASMGEMMLQRAEQIAAKPPAPRLRATQRRPFQNCGEKLMRNLASSIGLAPTATEESDHRLVVRGAEFAERGLCFITATGCTENKRPAGNVKRRSHTLTGVLVCGKNLL
jgi:hypothetical protein